MDGIKILVHGGGVMASQVLQRMGIEPKIIDGRRISDADTLKAVVMVYAGWINTSIVAGLQALNCAAVGLSGADGNTIVADKRPAGRIDYGFAGDIREVNTKIVTQLLDAGIVPVFCSVTHDGKGQLLNTNADTIAAALAVALAPEYAVELLYCFEKNGVLQHPADEQSVIAELSSREYKNLVEQGVITTGMIPKLDNGFAALGKGVRSVGILHHGALSERENRSGRAGTRLVI